MQMANSNLAKVLVWLAAVLMPWDLSVAIGCPCGDGKADIKTSNGCCHSSSGCRCCHANETKRSCCQSKKATVQSPPGSTGSMACTCGSKNRPEPQNQPAGSQNQKEQAGPTPSNAVPAIRVPTADARCPTVAESFSDPLSALARCETLCRFLI
jgi:hypothetical protein